MRNIRVDLKEYKGAKAYPAPIIATLIDIWCYFTEELPIVTDKKSRCEADCSVEG
jgi:hypothetical protein